LSIFVEEIGAFLRAQGGNEEAGDGFGF